jgi:hypothetical protein
MLKSRDLIVIDIAGAFLTSLITFAFLATDVLPTGMPFLVLIGLGIAAAMLGSFGACRLATSSNHLNTLAILAFLNIDFCVLSGVLWWSNFERLTLLGKFYFPAEILVIMILALVESRWAIAKS